MNINEKKPKPIKSSRKKLSEKPYSINKLLENPDP